MLKRIFVPVIFAVLAYGFWVSPDFKEIAAGVAIFLFGMFFLEEGFRAFTGGLLGRLLRRTTDRMWKSVAFGIVTTTIMQSSSLVSVITISFLSAGLIELVSGIGIIFGANIGTTTGAWLVAGFGLKVDIAAFAMPMLVFGAVLVFQKSTTLKGVGYILAGMGFLFLGIHFMKSGFEAFKQTIDLTAFAMTGVAGLLVYTLVGMFATVVMQSSHATLVLTITALAAGQITYANGLALAIGANVGTTITAILGALSSNYQGRRLAGAHLIFNLVTGVIAIVLISPIMWAVDGIAAGIGIAADDYTLKLAVFHTIFNVVGVVVMTPAVGPLMAALNRLFPRPAEHTVQPRFITDAAFDFPDTLVGAVRREILHLYDNAFEILAHGLSLHRADILSDRDLTTVVTPRDRVIAFDLDAVYVTKVKSLYGAIIEFISRAQTKLPPAHSSRLFELRNACHGVVGGVKEIKHLRRNLATYMVSDNADMRAAYTGIRLLLARLFRDIHRMRDVPIEERDVFALDAYKTIAERENVIADGTMDRLIRDGRITPQMASSLMNDVAYARDVVTDLVDMAKAVFGTIATEIRPPQSLVGVDAPPH